MRGRLTSITTHRFNMDAEVLRLQTVPVDGGTETTGEFTQEQDPITGEILNVWTPASPAIPVLGNQTPSSTVTIPCTARALISQGVSGAANAEVFGEDYQNLEYVNLWCPAKYKISKADRITNIRDKANGTVIWTDDEYDGRPTVFNVRGVTPLFNGPWNHHIENLITLEKAPASGS